MKKLFLGIVVLMLCGCSGERAADTESPDSVYTIEITALREKGGRVDWSHALNVIAFDKAGDDGYYDVYIMDPDEFDETCLTCTPELSGHTGNPAWHPSGEWIVFQAVNTALIPLYRDAEEVKAYTNPGAGWLNDLWVTDKNGQESYQLTTIGVTGGVLHPHFSHDGTKLLWAERVGGNARSTSGEWVLKVADFVIAGHVPRLEHIQSYAPGEQHDFYESHGFSPDDTKILFSGNLQEDQPMWGMDIYEFNLETHELTQLTHTFYDWDEHAQYSPDGQKIVWMSSEGYDINPLKTDFWIMDCTGSHKQQVTFFNTPGHPHYRGTAAVAADSSWGPDGTSIIAYVKTESAGVGSEGCLVMIELEEYNKGRWVHDFINTGLEWSLFGLLIYVTSRRIAGVHYER
jgi:Tol biopolymer transport system component